MADENDEGSGGERRPFDIEGALNSLIARNGNDQRAALRTLSEDNFQYRRTIRKLKQQIEDLSKRPVLKEGEKIVGADRAKTLEDFEALKVKVEDVKNGLSERDTLKNKEAERKHAEAIATGVKPLRMNAEVMADLIRTRSLQHELRDVEIEDEVTGKTVTASVLHLRKADGDNWSPANKFAEKELKGYLPALRLSDDDESEESANDEAADASHRDDDDQPRHRPFPKQASGAGSKAPRNSADVVDKHIRGRYTLPSQLRQKQDT